MLVSTKCFQFQYNAYMIKTMLLGLIQCFPLKAMLPDSTKRFQVQPHASSFNKMAPGSLKCFKLPYNVSRLPVSIQCLHDKFNTQNGFNTMLSAQYNGFRFNILLQGLT